MLLRLEPLLLGSCTVSVSLCQNICGKSAYKIETEIFCTGTSVDPATSLVSVKENSGVSVVTGIFVQLQSATGVLPNCDATAGMESSHVIIVCGTVTNVGFATSTDPVTGTMRLVSLPAGKVKGLLSKVQVAAPDVVTGKKVPPIRPENST